MRIDLEKAEAALLLLVAAALAVAAALLLAARLALLAALLLALAVLAGDAGHATRLGHLYLILLFFIRGGWQKLMNAAAGSGACTMSTRILLLDTETNGLPKNRYAPSSEPGVWPAILQLSWAIYRVEAGGSLIRQTSQDVGVSLDPGIPWDAGAAKIHGLSEYEGRNGTPAITVLTELAAALRTVDVVVAHNLDFDKSVIRAAGYAVGIRDLWPPIKELCTMRASTDVVRLPPTAKQAAYNISQFKSPRLSELFEWLFNATFDISGSVLHSAKGDVHCLAMCVGELLRRGLLSLPSASA